MTGATATSAAAAAAADDVVPALAFSAATKRYGRRLAVDGLSFEVRRGELFGLLGPNGAGKSTTLGMAAGLVRPTSGGAALFGLDARLPAARARLGAMIEAPAFHPRLSARLNLRALALAQGGVPAAAIEAALQRVGLSHRAAEPVAGFSQGMKQRLGLAQALMHSPDLLLLDEPTNGLDPEGAAAAWRLFRDLARREDRAVLVSTHLLHDVETWCDRVAVLDQGRLVACGAVADLLADTGQEVWFGFSGPENARRAKTALSSMKGIDLMPWAPEGATNAVPGGTEVPQDDPDPAANRPPWTPTGDETVVRARVPRGGVEAAVAALAAAGVPPRAVVPRRKSLERFFLELTARKGSGDTG